VAESFGGFSGAERRGLLSMPGGLGAIPLICYEAIFPRLAEIDGERGDLLLNLTNDAWYGFTPGPYQHLRQAQLRAVETRLPLVRAANNGISVVTDAVGRIVEACRLATSACSTSNFRLGAPQPGQRKARQITFGLIVAIMVILTLVGRRSKSYSSD
jgi:apolipoprotein N-acyltransferase